MIAAIGSRAACRPAHASAPVPAKVWGGTRCGSGDQDALCSSFPASEFGGGERACLGPIMTEECQTIIL